MLQLFLLKYVVKVMIKRRTFKFLNKRHLEVLNSNGHYELIIAAAIAQLVRASG